MKFDCSVCRFFGLFFRCSYLQYSQIVGQALRNVLKGEAKQAAARRENVVVKFAKWENGKQTNSRTYWLALCMCRFAAPLSLLCRFLH